ncbi:MFS transporter [Clostridiales bacterium F-3ap]|uniref:MFS transporter n=2 Tax=Anaerotalea alkaliphila TaxID=2662126 RepID=A0A7X5HY71_9FIRM|nr:MFS transporter [Anaerotalea alkaliphila]
MEMRKKIYYGWVIVAVAALGQFFSGPGQTFSISLFINAYIDKFGWSRTLLSSLYSFATLAAGLLLPFVGRKIDRIGYRKMIAIVPFLLALTGVWMGMVRTPAMIFLGFMFLRLFGQGSMSLIPSALVSQWFIRKRGLALSFMTLGMVASSAAFPQMNNWLLENYGIEQAWRFIALLLVVVMVPAGWLLVRDRPEAVGLLPDGETKPEMPEIPEGGEAVGEDHSEWTLGEAFRVRSFWLLLFCMTIPSMINTGMIFHLVSIMEEKGQPPVFAATILSSIAMVQLGMNFVAGYVVDKTKPNRLKALNYLVLAVGMLVILWGRSAGVLLLYAVFSAVFNAFDSVTTNVLWPGYFGRRHLGSIKSVAMTAMVLGSALGPLPFGVAYDLFQSYDQVILVMLAFPLLASIASFLATPPVRR